MSHTRVVRRLILPMVVLLCIGCAHEKKIGSSYTVTPTGQLTPPPPANGKVFFIGRSLGVNILDERNGINAAIDDAAMQIAKDITREVGGRVEFVDSRKGEAIRGKETTEQAGKNQFVFDVSTIVSGVTQEDAYWERWSVREKSLGEGFARYRYYVLVSYPQDELNRQRELVKKKMTPN